MRQTSRVALGARLRCCAETAALPIDGYAKEIQTTSSVRVGSEQDGYASGICDQHQVPGGRSACGPDQRWCCSGTRAWRLERRVARMAVATLPGASRGSPARGWERALPAPSGPSGRALWAILLVNPSSRVWSAIFSIRYCDHAKP